MHTENQLIYVPIAHLNPVANGVRKTNGISIENLAASIKAEGLLQNLTVVRDATQPKDERYIVIAGSRRLRALRHLVDTSEIAGNTPVPCLLIDEAQALTASTAENTIREQMHPADEFVAFRDMIAAGRTPEKIAARFGVTPLVVQRRLKLANVSPKIFEEFRTDRVTLDQMMALALVDDHKLQEKIWFKTEHWHRSAADIREILTKKEIDASKDPIAKFVGLAEYERAGGVVHRDLFDDHGGGFIVDVALLRDLAQKKLSEAMETVRHEGWAWVEPSEDFKEYRLYEYTVLKATGARKPTDLERKREKELTAELDELRPRLEQLRADESDNDAENAEYERLDTRERELTDQLDQLKADRRTWSAKQLSESGAIVSIANGVLKIYRGLIKGTHRQAADDSKKAKKDKAKQASNGAGHSDALMRQLSACVSFAITAELIANPGAALILLTHKLVSEVFYRQSFESRSVVCIASGEHRAPQLQDLGVPNVKGNPDLAKMMSEEKALRAMLPAKQSELFDYLKKSNAVLSRLLAYCTAVTVNAVIHSEDSLKQWPARQAAEGICLDMRTRWTVNAENYLERVSAAHILAALKEAGADKAKLAAAEGMKKAELVKMAQPILAAANWIPKPLRFDVATPAKK